MQIIVSLLCGLLFGLGLIISGMVDPAKVIGFLDIAGNWDPSLALVMVGGIAVGLIGFKIAGKEKTPVLGGVMHLPTRRDIDRPLIIGSIIFGAGWGVAGLCPGPALVSLGTGAWQAIYFVAAMLVGMAIYGFLEKLK